MNGKTNKLIRLELKLLNEISKSKNHSQRSLSKDLNVALGLANALIKKFVSKGILKLQEIYDKIRNLSPPTLPKYER